MPPRVLCLRSEKNPSVVRAHVRKGVPVHVGEEEASRALDRMRIGIPRPEFDIPQANGLYLFPRIEVAVVKKK